MRVKESIAELTQICIYSRETDSTYRLSWGDKIIGRIAVYFIKLFLEIGISANQATSIGLVITVIGGVFLAFSGPGYWFIGIALLWLWVILGSVDGGIARYNKTASAKGAFWNAIAEQFAYLYRPICISFGIYGTVHNIYPFILGFLAVMAIWLTTSAQLLPYPLLREKRLLSEALATNKTESEGQASIIIKYGRLLFSRNLMILLLWFLLATIIDCFISPFTIGSLIFNARYICFIMYVAVWVASAIRNIYFQLRSGVTLRF